MDNEQIKLILSTYRSGGEDASDPFFAEALEQVRRDPKLSAWFAEQRQFDESIQAALQTIHPPAQLRPDVLINRRVIQFHVRPRLHHRTFTRPTLWLSMAACFLIVLALPAFLNSRSSGQVTIEQVVKMAFDLEQNDAITHGQTGGGNESLRTWLAAQGAPSHFTLPSGLQSIEGMGCQAYSVNGQMVGLICFLIEEDRYVHFFVTDSKGLDRPPGSVPDTFSQNGLLALAWSADGVTYVLLSRDIDEAALRGLI